MSGYEKTENILLISRGFKYWNVSERASLTGRNIKETGSTQVNHRETSEDSLATKVVEKVQSLNKGGHLAIRYRIRNGASEPLTVIQESCRSL